MYGNMKHNLDDSLEQFKLITEQSLIGISILQDGVFKYINDRFAETSGYSVEEIKSWAPNEFVKTIHPEDREFVMEQARKKQAGDPDVVPRYQYRSITKSGETIWVELFGKTINYKGRPADLIMTFNNTEKAIAQQNLKLSEERFRNFFKGMPYYATVWRKIDNDFIIVDINKNYRNILRRDLSEVIGSSASEMFLNHQNRPDVIEALNKCLNEKITFTRETELYVEGVNSKRNLLVALIYIPPDFVLTVSQDITQKKIAQQKLEESESKFRNITEQSLIGIAIIQDGVFKYVNDRYAETSGYSVEELKSWAPNEFKKMVHPEDREFVMKQARKKQEGDLDVINQYKFRVITKNGEIRWRKIYSKTINYESRTADLVMNLDITDEMKAEYQLHKSKEEYRNAYNQAEFYKDLFIHDISNILQSLYSSIQLMEMVKNESETKSDNNEYIEVIYGQINRGKKLISNVRKLSQLDDYKTSFGELDLLDTLNHSIELVKNSFKNRKIQINIVPFDKKISIFGNDLLQDVFENILINSVKHNKNDIIEILIKITQVNQDGIINYKLEFIDNGIGIVDARKKTVLYRIDKDSKTTYGLGLGLSLVKKIIENYNGKIWIEDKVRGEHSKGTNIVLLIPKGDPDD